MSLIGDTPSRHHFTGIKTSTHCTQCSQAKAEFDEIVDENTLEDRKRMALQIKEEQKMEVLPDHIREITPRTDFHPLYEGVVDNENIGVDVMHQFFRVSY